MHRRTNADGQIVLIVWLEAYSQSDMIDDQCRAFDRLKHVSTACVRSKMRIIKQISFALSVPSLCSLFMFALSA